MLADDTAIYCSGKDCNEIQNKMNEDLALVKKWLNEHRLTLNITKSKFVMVGGKQQLKHFQDLTLKIEEDELSRESSCKYIGIIINEDMGWGDHIASLLQKVAKRMGLLKRISHLIPGAQRLTLVSTMIIPLLNYGDTIWGDRRNKCLMKTLRVLHNKFAKLILNMKPYDSSKKTLDSLHWKSLDFRRKFHRCATIYKSKKNDISYTISNKTGRDIHKIQTRNNEQQDLFKVRTNWGKQVSSYLFIDKWNKLDKDIKSAGNFDSFKQRFWAMLADFITFFAMNHSFIYLNLYSHNVLRKFDAIS